MNRIKAAWAWLTAKTGSMRLQLRLCLRMTIAAMLTYSISQLLHLPWPLWAVLTSVIVTQMSVGKSLKATLDYMEGTLGGAVYSGIVGALIPHTSNMEVVLSLGVAVAPLSLLATMSPRFAAAPFTAVMVLLLPTITHTAATTSAFYRVIEVAVGCVTSLAVSFLVFPERAHSLVIDGAAQMLNLMARAVPELFAGFLAGNDPAEVTRIQNCIGQAFLQLNTSAVEAKRERAAYFNADPDPQPLVATLLRVRHDLVMIGRAAVQPLPPSFKPRLMKPINDISATTMNFLRDSAMALLKRDPPPSLDTFEAALDAYTKEFARARNDGLTRALSGEVAEHIFALGFVLEQLHRNFHDLSRAITEYVRPEAAAEKDADSSDATVSGENR